jgi:hypothetical protein
LICPVRFFHTPFREESSHGEDRKEVREEVDGEEEDRQEEDGQEKVVCPSNCFRPAGSSDA